MRGLLLGGVFFALLPLIFIRGPFVGILMWFWVSLMAPQFVVWGFFANIQYALIVAIVTLVSWLVFSREPKAPPHDKVTLLICLLMIWVSITSYLGTGPKDLVYADWLLTEKMLLMTLVAYALTNTRERLDQLVTVCALSVAFYGFKGGVFTLLHGGAYRVYGPSGSMIGDNNELGVALTMVLPLLFYMWQRYRQTHLKWSIAALIGFTLIGDFFTYSRGALLAVGAVAGVAWWRSRRKLASALLFLGIAAVMWNFAPPEWLGRMQTIKTYQVDDSAEQRLYVWRLGWAIALQRPIIGAGFRWSFDPTWVNRQLAGEGFHWRWRFTESSIALPSDSDTLLPPLISPRAMHSIWVEMVSAHGFPGLIIFVAILLCVAIDTRWLLHRTQGRPELGWAFRLGQMLQASLVAFAVGGSFASLQLYDGFYIIVIMAAVARRVVTQELAKATALTEPAAAVAAQSGRRFRPQPIG